MNIFKITTVEKGKRLDKFLMEKLSDFSRTKIQTMIKAGLVAVNQKEATVHQFLKEADQIEILTEPLKLSAKAQKKTREKKEFTEDPLYGKGVWKKIKIIDDTDEYLIIEKPAGLLVHPTVKAETNTLIDWAAEKYPEIAKIGDEPGRAGIVHRLDKEVSGLMVLPKTQTAFEYFKRLFKIRQIEKKYTALVWGKIKADEDEINFSIGRSKNKPGLFAAFPIGSEEGRPAKTIFRVMKRFINYTLLEVEILTGRTHQIRVHLLAYGHPIIGDILYAKKQAEKSKCPRIFLHASHLSFIDSEGIKKEYNSEVPGGLKDFLKKVK
jgi:23S rRNA pseudouridine1911/1915/1917 synthase